MNANPSNVFVFLKIHEERNEVIIIVEKQRDYSDWHSFSIYIKLLNGKGFWINTFHPFIVSWEGLV